MNLFEELQPRIEAFRNVRDHVVNGAHLPPRDGAVSFGNPPFAIDDGTDYYAVVDEGGNVSPLPFGYQVPDEDIATEDADVIYSRPMSMAGSGMNIARYVPLVSDFQCPGERAFCLEVTEGSDAWEAVGQTVEAIQNILNEKALFNFNQRLSNVLVSLYSGCEELESIDQTISALCMDPSVLAVLVLRSHQFALDSLEDEMSAEEDEDE